MKTKRNTKLGILLFSFGTLVGLTLVLFLVWADLEARLFDPSLSAKSGVGLSCPAFIGAGQTAKISASFRNPLERDVRYSIRTSISEGHVTLMRRLDTLLSLEPGERQRLEWEVRSEDAAYGLFALAKVHLFGLYPLPARQGSCGIVSVPLPLPGNLLFVALLVLTALTMGGGWVLWYRASLPLHESSLPTARALVAFSVLVAMGVVVGLLNVWIVGVVLLAVSLLLVFALLAHRAG